MKMDNLKKAIKATLATDAKRLEEEAEILVRMGFEPEELIVLATGQDKPQVMPDKVLRGKDE